MRQMNWIWVAIGLAGCRPDSSKDDSASAETTDATTTVTDDDGDDSGTTVDPNAFPSQPAPFTITLDGVSTATLTFEQPTCSHRTGSTSFRHTWRGSDHVFILVVEMFDTFPAEVGAYTQADGVRTRLQEEAGGRGAYFDSNFDGSGASLTIDGFDTTANHVWGSATVGSLGDGSGGMVTVAPDTIPIWCDSME